MNKEWDEPFILERNIRWCKTIQQYGTTVKRALIDISFIIFGFAIFQANSLYAAQFWGSPAENIDNARIIWQIDKINNPNDEAQIRLLEDYLESSKVPIARMAARKFALPGFNAHSSILLNVKNQNYYVRATIGLICAFNRGQNLEQAFNNATAYLDSNYTSHLSFPLADDIDYLSWIYGWQNNPNKYIGNETTMYDSLKYSINGKSSQEKARLLVGVIWDYESDNLAIAAINILIENRCIEAISLFENKIEDKDGRLIIISPSDHKMDVRILSYLDLLISMPDSSSLPIINKLKESNLEDVATEAATAIPWIESGIPYPYKYRKLMGVNPPR